MKFQDIGRAIVKRSWIVIALLLISLLVAAIVTQAQDPIYKVEIAVSAMAPNNPTTKLPDATIQASFVVLMRSMANYAEGLDVAEAVSRRLAQEGIDITPEELLGKVSAVPETNSTSIKITVSDVSPTRVADIANTWGEVLALKTLKSEANEYFDENLKALILNGTLVFTNRAVPPSKPTQPKPAVYLGLGAFVGLLLGLTIAVLIEYFDPHFRTPQETEELLGLPVLGILPREKGEKALQLLPAFGEGSRTWEAYSELRSGLILTRREEAPRSILAVAAIPFEAGPAVAANLAMSIAATGRDTLLVDCDLRAGALSGLLGVAGRPGLSDALAGDGDLKGRAIAGKFPNLSLLPSGSRRENSTDLLSLPSFARNLRELESLYDQVVLYAPPLSGSMDAAVVASQAQACLVIIDSGLCTRKAAVEAMHNLRLLGIVPSGVALANVKMKERARAAASVRPAAPAVGAAVPAASPPVRERKPAVAAPAGPVAAPAAAATPGEGAGAAKEREKTPGAAQQPDRTLEDFRRMGEKGEPIPKNWLRALNSEKREVRETATAAITTYYHSFLRRYRISEESVKRITDSIIRMMRREGEFAGMSEAEAQRHLQKLLIEAGAGSPGRSAAKNGAGTASREEGGPGAANGRDPKRKEKHRLRLHPRGEE
ncbi:MAG: hypothetical protein H5T73_06165 [Actinobacteria bacterium]|nr:hypothetical protein [Actinomycetota bacterium]